MLKPFTFILHVLSYLSSGLRIDVISIVMTFKWQDFNIVLENILHLFVSTL